MPPPKLPTHLSYKSALVLLPPGSIAKPIEALRQKHDKHFDRWPPHINLIYPFLADPSSPPTDRDVDPAAQPVTYRERGSDVRAVPEKPRGQLKTEIQLRLRKVLSNLQPLKAVLSANPPGHFIHSKRSATVWLDPLSPLSFEADPSSKNSAGTSDGIKQLQAALQAEFSECNADERPFTPHLSIGQAPGNGGAEELSKEAQKVVEDFIREQKGGNNTERLDAGAHGLDWNVDSVFVIERKGYNGRFRVVGSVTLGGD